MSSLTKRRRLFRLRLDLCKLGDEWKEGKGIKGKAPWQFYGWPCRTEASR